MIGCHNICDVTNCAGMHDPQQSLREIQINTPLLQKNGKELIIDILTHARMRINPLCVLNV